MTKRLTALFLASTLSLSACADITAPVAVIGPNGDIYRGTTTASWSGEGTFEASRGNVRCAGTYDPFNPSPTISFQVQCSNGLKGIGTAIREANGIAGAGNIRMSDGTDWRFVFGRAAETF